MCIKKIYVVFAADRERESTRCDKKKIKKRFQEIVQYLWMEGEQFAGGTTDRSSRDEDADLHLIMTTTA